MITLFLQVEAFGVAMRPIPLARRITVRSHDEGFRVAPRERDLLVTVPLGFIDKAALLFRRVRNFTECVDDLDRRMYVEQLHVQHFDAGRIPVEK